jgi:uncharacterized protein YfeS
MSEPLTVWIGTQHPICYGGGGIWVEALESLMEEHLQGFGPALREIEVTVSFATKLPPLKTFESSWPEYHNALEKLPTARFLRVKKAFKLQLFARFGMAEDTWGPFEGATIPNALIGEPGVLRKVANLKQEYLPAFAALVIENLALLKKRLKKTDAFDYAGFAVAATRITDLLPKDIDAAKQLAAKREARHDSIRGADPWFAVSVDWDDFHLDARKLLNDPWFWDGVDSWAPHGNDTGADLLVDMTKGPAYAWGAIREAVQTLESMGTNWLETDGGVIRNAAERDPQMYMICEQTLIAAAFAEIKLNGSVSGHFYSLARNALQRLSHPLMIDFWCGHLDEDKQQEWRHRHTMMASKLREIGGALGPPT